MRERQHPESEQIDLLRAGLLDDQQARKKALEEHIAGCQKCQARMGSWAQLGPLALGPQFDEQSLQADLRTARRQALASIGRRHTSRYLAPLAAAAVLLVAVSAGLWTLMPGDTPVSQMTAQTGDEIPDLYEDLDFYLWLATHGNNDTSRKHTDPNNT